MIRFIVKEVDTHHVVFDGGQPKTCFVSFEGGDEDALEEFLRYEDLPDNKFRPYIVRELVGVELLEQPTRNRTRGFYVRS